MEKIRAEIIDGVLEICGNRKGLLGLAEICQQLAALPENREESAKLGNHYHYAPWANNTEDDSVAFDILYDPEM
jgi:hypothetical protein